MAQKIVILLEDDIDGGDAVETVQFAFGGVDYVIDLNESNASEFKDVMSKYVGAARREARGKTKTAATATVRTGPSPKEVRAWAIAAGVEVNVRGRIKQEIVDQYLAAQ